MFTLVVRESGNGGCAGSVLRTPASDPNNAVMLCRAEHGNDSWQTGSCTVCQVFTARKRSCGKVMFLHLSVILFTGGVSVQDESLSRVGLCPRGSLSTGSLSRRVSVQGVSVQGVSVRGYLSGRPPYSKERYSMHPTGMHSCFLYFLRVKRG